MGSMAGDHHTYRILVIQPWTAELEVVETSLRAAGIDAAITRVDFPATLNAALVHERFDAAIFDPAVTELTPESVEQSFRLNGQVIPLVVIDDARRVGVVLQQVLGARKH